jgi:hypothetical protein
MAKACPECGATKTKMGIPFLTNGQIATHRMASHGVKADSAKKPPAKKAAPKKAAPTTTTARRHSTAAFFTKNLGRAAKFAEQVSVPGGRALAFSSYAAGPALDELIAGTRLDKPVQKMAAASDKWERVGDAVGLPVMVMMCDANPHLYKYFEDDMRDALRGVLIAAIPQLKKKREEEQKVVVALTELAAIDPALAASDDPIGDILASFFAPAPGQVIDVEPVMDPHI